MFSLYKYRESFLFFAFFQVERGKLKKHPFKSYEADDKPQLIVNKKAHKLPGKAVSIWLHMRSFGMIIQNLVPDFDFEDEVFLLAMGLSKITERLTASEFRDYEIDILEEMIQQYLDNRKEVFNQNPVLGTPKPKHHFLYHYGEAIRKFGPPLTFWTGRYEAKHRVAKGTAESAKNFKNISLTLAVRQQMRMASKYYSGFFDTAAVHLPGELTSKESLPEGLDLFDKLKEFMAPSDAVCKEVVSRGQKYQTGDIIVLKAQDSDSLEIGVILSILVKPSKVFFVTRRYEAVRNPFNCFVTKTLTNKSPTFVNALKLADFKPLVKYGTDQKFKFYLHHHISYDHE